MPERVSTYRGQEVEITYNVDRCMHAAECGRGSKALFDSSKKPWCSPDAVSAELAMAVVARCPSGALQIRALDGATPPPPEPGNHGQLSADGPVYLSGDLSLDGAPVPGGRVALCRCGQSARKPYCDGAHAKTGFQDTGAVGRDPKPDALEPGALAIMPQTDGPVMLEGPLELRAASGRTAFRGRRVALCRCGGSANKPFCDGSHKTNGFQSG